MKGKNILDRTAADIPRVSSVFNFWSIIFYVVLIVLKYFKFQHFLNVCVVVLSYIRFMRYKHVLSFLRFYFYSGSP